MTEFDVIKKKIRDKMNQIADDLATGTAKDFGEYRYMTGIIHGLALVESDILDLEKRVNED